MVKKILKDENAFAKFLAACKNITGEHPKLITTGLPFDVEITESIFNSSSLKWQTGIASNGEGIFEDDAPDAKLISTKYTLNSDNCVMVRCCPL